MPAILTSAVRGATPDGKRPVWSAFASDRVTRESRGAARRLSAGMPGRRSGVLRTYVGSCRPARPVSHSGLYGPRLLEDFEDVVIDDDAHQQHQQHEAELEDPFLDADREVAPDRPRSPPRRAARRQHRHGKKVQDAELERGEHSHERDEGTGAFPGGLSRELADRDRSGHLLDRCLPGRASRGRRGRLRVRAQSATPTDRLGRRKRSTTSMRRARAGCRLSSPASCLGETGKVTI